MIHTDSDEGPVPVEVLQFQAAKAKEADLAAALQRAEDAEVELKKARREFAMAEGCMMIEQNAWKKRAINAEALLARSDTVRDTLSADLAAARRERDRLREHLEDALTWAEAYGIEPEWLVEARAVLEKANG